MKGWERKWTIFTSNAKYGDTLHPHASSSQCIAQTIFYCTQINVSPKLSCELLTYKSQLTELCSPMKFIYSRYAALHNPRAPSVTQQRTTAQTN